MVLVKTLLRSERRVEQSSLSHNIYDISRKQIENLMTIDKKQ